MAAKPITAAMIKELRARTGAGMMDCKESLTAAGGDIDAAIELLRKKGVASAEKKAGRIAAEGVIVSAGDTNAAVVVEVNCETDFVAKDATFNEYANRVAAAILTRAPADIGAVGALPLGDDTIESARQSLIVKIGENIGIRRFARAQAPAGGGVGIYLHGARIGVLVAVRGGDENLRRDLAMHVAASAPLCIGEQDMPAKTLESERAIYLAQAEQSGKPAAIAETMVSGRMKKFLKENTLLGQPFIKDADRNIAELLGDATVESMTRFEVGEGLAKREDDFVAEVMAQARAR